MPKITKKESRTVIQAKTQPDSKSARPGDWWNSHSKKELGDRLLATFEMLKKQDQYRFRQDSLYAALYGKVPLFGAVGANLSKISTTKQLPSDRPTMSIVTSIVDTITSRLVQSKPRPLFLTDNGDHKQRKLAKEMNRFIAGEFYQTKFYAKNNIARRDACVWGTGVLKVLEDANKRVALERRLRTQILVDPNEVFIGSPRQMYEFALVDRDVLGNLYSDKRSVVDGAEQAYAEQADTQATVSDQVIVVEAWRLPSHPEANDGLHVIACSAGVLLEEKWGKDFFPFAFRHYIPPQVGFWGQGVAERQMGNQASINGLLATTHKAIRLVGVPRVFVEDGSKVVKAQLNNEVGSIVTYRGTKPSYEVAPCMPAEIYQEIQNVINRAYQEEGISQLAASSEKPAGLNSGEAIRAYDERQEDRLATLSMQDEEFATEVAYLVIDKAREICKREGKYETVYPDKNGTQQIDLPKSKELDNPFVIQCFEVSSLPRDPAGRLQKVTEMMQAGIVTPQEGRRLLNLPDTEQEDQLAMAAEEKIYKQLDDIVENGKYTPPDPFTDLALAEVKVVQYYNLYTSLKLEEKKAEMLRDYYKQVQALKAQAAQAQPPMPGVVGATPTGPSPQAIPGPAPQSELMPSAPGAAA